MTPKPLPRPPAIRLTITRDHPEEARAKGGFLDVRRVELVAQYPDGTASLPFRYDIGSRAALDAVVIAAHYRDRDNGVTRVFLRTAVRPACAFRPIPPAHDGALWELPAGLIEVGEDPPAAAARELGEEVGFFVDGSAMKELGPWTFPTPGVIGERHLFFSVEVDPTKRQTPSEDGSALERAASILDLPLEDALFHCRNGAIRDAKTELALRRLSEAL